MGSRNERSTNRIAPLFLIGAGLVLVIGVILLQLANPSQPATGDPSGRSMAKTATDPLSAVKRVNLADARQAFDAKTATFVDVRDPDSYQSSHIPGSINIPLGDLEGRYRELNPNSWIITYCT